MKGVYGTVNVEPLHSDSLMGLYGSRGRNGGPAGSRQATQERPVSCFARYDHRIKHKAKALMDRSVFMFANYSP